MKKVLMYAAMLFVMFMFTGCVTNKINYTQDYTQYNLNKNINKVKDMEVSIEYPEGEIGKKANSFAGGGSKTVLSNRLNAEIMKDYLSQYFEDVAVSRKGSYENFTHFKIETKIIDFQHSKSAFSGAIDLEISIDVKVSLGDKTILNKTYKEFREGEDIVMDASMRTGWDFASEQFHKHILAFYKEEFKTDLLKALKENI